MNKPVTFLNIDGKIIAKDKPTYFIADIAANHDGDLSRAKDLIYMAAEAGADAAKFQHFQASTIVSKNSFDSMTNKLSHQSKWSKSVYEVYQDASVSLDWTGELVDTCKKAGIPFFTTPYSLQVVDEIDSFVPAYKIGSGDITWKEMITKIASKKKPYILASGASTSDEVVNAVQAALSVNDKLCLMQCNTNYTASLENFKYINLKVIETYQLMFPNLIIGLSDHTPGHATVLGAISLGARMIEKHFTDDNNRVGPDHLFSMNPKSWKEMVDRTRELELALGTGVKKVEENEKESIIVQRRSLVSKRKILKGEVLSANDIKIVRPCPIDGIEPNYLERILGKKVKVDIDDDINIKREFLE